MAVPTVLVAQTSSTSALGGVIRDGSGKPVAGALVRINSATMIGGEKTTVSAENGAYRFSALPPGSFRISVSAKGLVTQTQNALLELGRTATVNWKLPSANAGATVEVVASTARVDDAAVGQTQNFDTTALATLPVDRTITAIMDLTPGVNGNRAWGGYSGENAYMMDGVNISDPSGGTVWIYPNVDWFSEVQVAGLGANAEFGGYMGGFVNGLVKRGGNTFEGNVSAYYADSKWQSRINVSHPDLQEADKDILPTKNWDVAAGVGGPIIKDKLWFFVSAERSEQQTSPTGAELPQRDQKVMALAKLTWAPTTNTTLEFLAEHDYVGRDRRYIDKYTMPEATQKESAPNHSYSLTWTQTMDSDKVLTVKAFGYSGRYDMPGYGGNALSLDTIDLWQYDPKKPAREFYNNSTYEDFNYRARATVQATFDWFKTGLITSGDSHAFRFGIEREQASDEELERFPGNLNLNATIYQYDDGTLELDGDYLIQGGGWNVRQRVDRLAAFAQDTWRVNDRLTISPGLRFEQFKARFYGGDTLWNKSTYAPRLGVAYALTADQTTMLKAHWGKYYAGYSTYFIDRAIQSAIPMKRYYSWGNYPVIGNVLDPSTWPDHTPGTADNYEYRRVNDLTLVDPNARQPYTIETTVSIDHKFGTLWSATASYVSRDFKDSLVRTDQGVDPKGTYNTFVNPLNGQNFNIWKPGTYYDPILDFSVENHAYVTKNEDSAKRKYEAATVTLDRLLSNSWSMNLSYTHASLKGNIQRADSYDKVYYNPNLQANSYGNLPGVNDHEFKARGLYELPWNMRLSATYTYLSGTHWTPTYRTDSYNSTRYAVNLEPLGSQTYPCRSLLDLRVTQMFNFTKKARMEVFVEVLNALNRQGVTTYITRANTNTNDNSSVYKDYKYPSELDAGRRLQLGARYNF
ncbi:TonB-dependent receptor [Mesoterricola silvestris]|uniref:TonB-dependent receptor n=1 Tax=Mesoterricola silvestris TaxID=2927979 RepID=UPI002931637F|nr:TonB-dependent receptor [Mesoterricola silvestris]